jgi:peroxiredoxin
MAAPVPRALAQRCLDCSVALWESLSTAAPVRTEVKAENARKLAPDFTLTDASGNDVKLSSFQGRVVLLNFWATWCGGCEVEIPWFIGFETTYRDRGLSVIGVSMDADGWKSVVPYVKEKHVTYPIVIGNLALAKVYEVDSMPVTLLIDRDGKIAASHVGLVTRSEYKGEIEALLRDRH